MNAYGLAVFPRNGGTIKDLTLSLQSPDGNRFFIDRKQVDGKWAWTLGRKMESKYVATEAIQVAPIA